MKSIFSISPLLVSFLVIVVSFDTQVEKRLIPYALGSQLAGFAVFWFSVWRGMFRSDREIILIILGVAIGFIVKQYFDPEQYFANFKSHYFFIGVLLAWLGWILAGHRFKTKVDQQL